jgi:hypothetical protein
VLTFDTAVRAWDVPTARTRPAPPGLRWTSQTSKYDREAFWGPYSAQCEAGKLTLRDAETGRSVTPKLDGSYAVAEILDARTGQLVFRVPSDRARFSSSGEKLLTWKGTEIHVWDADSGKELLPALQNGDEVWEAFFAQDESRILSTGHPSGLPRTLRLWDGRTGAPLAPVLTSKAGGFSQFTSDETRIVGAEYDEAEIRDGRTGQLLVPPVPLPHDWNAANQVQITADGTRLLFLHPGRSSTIVVRNFWTDFDWPRDRLSLRVEALTGTRLNQFDELEVLGREEWRRQRARYESIRGVPPGR